MKTTIGDWIVKNGWEEVHRHAFLAPSVLTTVSYLMTLEFNLLTGGADISMSWNNSSWTDHSSDVFYAWHD